jgi:thiol-disulfide isomerase/thioredoxin
MSVGLATAVVAGPKYGLEVGDAAPKLEIAEWVKGEETALETGQVYVVEFWATWCGPCRKSIPHLTKLQNELGPEGLTIIGVSDEDPNVVRPFVRKQGNKMDYTVVVDSRKTTSRTWMKAAGQTGIPTAFVVDRQGKLAFIGHPLSDEFETSLRQVLNGRYDPKLAKVAEPALRSARNARKMHNWRVAEQQYDSVIALDARVFANIAIERFQMVLVDEGEKERAYDYAREHLMNQAFRDDAGALRMLAESVSSDPKIDKADRDLDFALEAAIAAYELAGETDINAMATLARVRYHRGELDEAVRLQRQAWMKARPSRKHDLKRVLDSYQESASRTVASSAR